MQINKIKRAAEIAKAKTNDPKWIRAIERAEAGILDGSIIVTIIDHRALVTTATGQHWVNGHCDCKAAQFGHTQCVHRCAKRLVEIADELKEETAPATSGSIDPEVKAARPATITRSTEYNRNSDAIATVRCEGWLI